MKFELPDHIFPKLWSYDVYVHPFENQIIVVDEGETPLLDRKIDLSKVLAAFPIELSDIKILAYTGTALVLALSGDKKKVINYREANYYKV